MSSSFPPPADHHRLDADAGFLPRPPALLRALVPPPSLCRTSASTTSIAEGAATAATTPMTTLPSSSSSSSSCWAAINNNNKKHRSCGCAVVSVDDGGSYSSRCDQCSCAFQAEASVLPIMGTNDAGAAPAATSSTTIEMELEQCIKRVRLSSTPGELCLHKELRDLTTATHGWRWYDHYGAGARDAKSAVESEERMNRVPSALSRRRNRGVVTSTREDTQTASRSRRSRGSGAWDDSSCEYGWYEKILDDVATAGDQQQRQAAGDSEGEMRRACCCSCRMRLEALSTHRLALHLHYYYYDRARDAHDLDDNMHPSSHDDELSVATVHVDVRIPRHYPHQPPEVKSIRYSDDGNDSDSFSADMDDDSRTESPRRSIPLCRVDSIVLVPFVTDIDYDHGNDDDPGDQELSDSQDPVHVDPRDSMAGIPLHHLHVRAPVAITRRTMTLHGYSPVHRLSDVLERIAVALYGANVHNTTLVHTEHSTDSDTRSYFDTTCMHGNVGASAGSGRDAVGLSPSPTGAVSSSSHDASWASSAAAASAAATAATEADQATERQRSG